MDCEKFESTMMDELYGELDELTSAAAKRHIAGCARCAALLGGFRATRRVAALPRVEPPEGLESRILAAAAAATQVVPLGTRWARAVSLAGSWAMRPQTAMAAVFLVMIGTSVLLLRGKSSRAPASAEMTVTQEGTPAPAAPSLAAVIPEPASPSVRSAVAVLHSPEKAGPTSTPPPAGGWAQPSGGDIQADDPRQRALANRASAAKAADGAGSFGASPSRASPAPLALGGGAPRKASASSASEGEMAPAAPPSLPGPSAELSAARAARDTAAGQGLACPSGPLFDEAARRAGDTPLAWQALFEGALCYESAGDFASARTRLNAMLGIDAYRDRAQAELDHLNQLLRGRGAGTRRAAPKAPPPQAAPPAMDDGL
jgi:hypothetical protein